MYTLKLASGRPADKSYPSLLSIRYTENRDKEEGKHN